MIPILFEHDATAFTNVTTGANPSRGVAYRPGTCKPYHGIGDLTEATACTISYSDDGEYELELDYPSNGHLFNELKVNRIILALSPIFNEEPPGMHNDYLYRDPYQAFRIYGYEKKIDGTITVKAQHLSYDLAHVYAFDMGPNGFVELDDNEYGVVYKVYTPDNVASLIASNRFSSVSPCQFNISISAELFGKVPAIAEGHVEITEPMSARALLLDDSNSLKELWQCEFIYDNFWVYVVKNAGYDRGVSIVYGKDMTDLSQEENIGEMITGVIPFYYADYKDPNNEHESFVNAGIKQFVKGNVLHAEGTFDKENIVPLNLTEYFTEEAQSWTHCYTDIPLPSDLDYVASLWAKYNELGVPDVSLTVDYAKIGQPVYMGDAVRVYFERLGVDVKAQVCGCTYDVLAEHYTEIELGKSKSSKLWKGLATETSKKKGFIPGVDY